MDMAMDEDAVFRGDAQLVFMNPESLLSDTAWRDMFRTPVYKENLVALAVDEAHLVKKWYHFSVCTRNFFVCVHVCEQLL